MSDSSNNLIGTWTEGSIKVFYAGKGPARAFAQATVTDPSNPTITTVVHLDRAGHRRYDPTHQAADDAN